MTTTLIQPEALMAQAMRLMELSSGYHAAGDEARRSEFRIAARTMQVAAEALRDAMTVGMEDGK